MTHPFDAATRLESLAAGLWQGYTSAHYANMVGPFGGVTAATALAAVWRHPARLGEPISLTVNFAGPVTEGAFTVQADAVRTNRSTQHWLVQMRQGDDVVLTATVVTAMRRETWSSVESHFPAVPAAEDVELSPPLDRVRWAAAYEMRFIKGGLLKPAPQPDSESLLWLRDAPARELDHLSLTSLCDAFFPRLFVRRPQWAPIGTVSFSVYFHADAAVLAKVGRSHVLGHARAQQFRNGYFDQSAEMWSPQGELLAVTHQMVYYKE